jgi:hypothetical protein
MWTPGLEYQRLLASIETTLPLKKASNLSSAGMAKKIFALSEGTIGETVSLLNLACEFTIENKTEIIDINSLESCGYVRPSTRGKAITLI